MYKRQIRLWGLDKKHKQHEVVEILRLRAHRASQGKRSAFTLRGQPVDMENLRRYVRRRGLSTPCHDDLWLQEGHPSLMTQTRFPDLVCRTPSPSTLPSEPALDLGKTERFYLHFRQYMVSSIEAGAWTPSDDSPRLNSSLSVCGNFVDISETIQLGVDRFRSAMHQEAVWYWRVASSKMETAVRSWNLYQLLNLISGVALLADCDTVVADMFLRHLGRLVHHLPPSHTPQQAVLQSLSQLDPTAFGGLILFTRYCCVPVFQTYFCRHDDHILFWMAALEQTKALAGGWFHAWPLFVDLKLRITCDQRSSTLLLLAAERLVDALVASRNYSEAESLAWLRTERLQGFEQHEFIVEQLHRSWHVLGKIQCALGKNIEARQSLLFALESYDILVEKFCEEDRSSQHRHMLDVLEDLVNLETVMGWSLAAEMHTLRRNTLLNGLGRQVLQELMDEGLIADE